MNLQEFRKQYPQYDDMSDADLASSIHEKFYADMPREKVFNNLGVDYNGPAEDAAKGFASQVGRNIPEGLDMATALVGNVAQLAGDKGDYWKGFMQPRYTPYSDVTDAVVGPKYEPQTGWGTAGQVGGGFVGLNEVASAAKGASQVGGLLKGVVNGTEDFIKDPKLLKGIYQAWDKGLENIPLTSNAVQTGVVTPFNEATKFTSPFYGRDAREVVDAVNQLPAVADNARYVEGLRKSLSGNGAPVAQEARQAIGDFMQNSAIPQDGRDAYRRYMLSGDVTNATRNMGNEGIKATRTKINNIDPSGMTDAELAARNAAGRAGIGEGLLRGTGRVGGALMSAAAGLASGSPELGIGMYGIGRGLESVADKLANAKLQNLQSVILNGRAAPNTGEMLGGLLNSIGKKALKKGMGLLR